MREVDVRAPHDARENFTQGSDGAIPGSVAVPPDVGHPRVREGTANAGEPERTFDVPERIGEVERALARVERGRHIVQPGARYAASGPRQRSQQRVAILSVSNGDDVRHKRLSMASITCSTATRRMQTGSPHSSTPRQHWRTHGNRRSKRRSWSRQATSGSHRARNGLAAQNNPGPVLTGEPGPQIATVGTPTTRPRCATPVSGQTRKAAFFNRSQSSARSRRANRLRRPSGSTGARSGSSPGPALRTTSYPARSA